MPASPPRFAPDQKDLAKWNYVLCCAPAYLETHSTPHSPADLANHNCLLYAHSIYRDEFHFIDPAGNPTEQRPGVGNLLTASITVMRAAAGAGLGLCLCPPFVVSDLLVSGVLVPLLPDYRTQELEVALYPHRRQLSAKVRLLLDMLVERFADERRWLDAMPDR